jgi:hypothetical protein
LAVNVTITGASKVTARVKKFADEVRPAVRDAVNKVAGVVLNESQRRVPVDTGNLKASGRLVPATAAELNATVSYGGTAADYALKVHEEHRSGSKYLEEPGRESAGLLKSEVLDAVKRATS